MTIQEYARAVAEAVLMVCEESGLPDMDAEDVRESLSDIIASVPRPTAQHHDAPTCDGWWWARHSFNRRWEAVLYVYDGNQEEPEQYVVLNGQEEGRDVSEFDAWVGPLLPPDTTEPAPEVPEWSTCVLCGKQTERTEVACLDCQKYAVDLVRAPVAPPTPDIDPEKVRRALGEYFAGKQYSEFAVDKIVAAAREYLRLREQPAPDVQAHCVGCGHAAHALDCSEQGCLCPHSTDVQAYKEMYECGYEAGRDEVQAQAEWCARLPDGSGAAVVSFPLPDNHWLTAEHENVPPMPFRMGTDDPRRTEWKNAIRDAGKYAVRCATMNGADNDFDPDALVQNLVVGMIGYFTPDGFSSDAWANPEQPTPAILTDTDAAVARERERIIELVELKRAKFNIGTRASLALNDVLDQIRARSAKGV